MGDIQKYSNSILLSHLEWELEKRVERLDKIVSFQNRMKLIYENIRVNIPHDPSAFEIATKVLENMQSEFIHGLLTAS